MEQVDDGQKWWHQWMWVLPVVILIWWVAAGRVQYHSYMKTWGPDTAYYLQQGYKPGPDGRLYAPQNMIVGADGWPEGDKDLADPPDADTAARFPMLLLPGDREKMAAKERKDRERIAFRTKGH